MFSLPNNVTIIEVGPRDGLQNEKNEVSTENKLEFIHALQASGIQEMEITSFVSPKWVPQMSDAADIVERVHKQGRQLVLTPNSKGIERALQVGAKSVAVFVGVSNSFNMKNINKTTAQSMEELKPLITNLKQQGYFVRACISTAFHCPYEGRIAVEDTLSLCKEFATLGVDELSVADTIGMANPQESHALFSLLLREIPDVLMTAHFHDTRKMGLANIYATLLTGVSRFDTSAGGLGGCPFAPGATGNVATEDVVNMLHTMGVHTGIDLNLLCKAVTIIAPCVSRPIDTGMFRLYQIQQQA